MDETIRSIQDGAGAASGSDFTVPDAQAAAQNTPESIERNYHAVHDALAAKPAILKKILDQTRREADRDFDDSLASNKPYHPSDAARLANAEKQYQKALDQNADEVFDLFKHLPIERKLELLIEAEEIGEMNAKARTQALKEMRASHAQAQASHSEAKSSLLPEQPVARQIESPWAINSSRTDAIQHLMASPKPGVLGSNLPQSQAKQEAVLPEKGKHLTDHIGIGSPAALTINLPFTAIPGLPALNTVLQKIDRVAHLDMGFTIKGVADRRPNERGGYDELYRLSYVGAGIMSSKFNVQFAPLALNLEEKSDQAGWGGSSSVFAKRRSDLIGEKFSLNVGNDDVGVNFAPEASYQVPSNRIISNFTGGRYFGSDGPAVRVPGEYVGTLNRIIDALPTKEDMGVISDRIAKVIPVEQALEIGMSTIDTISEKISSESPAVTAAKFLLAHGVRSSGLSQQQQEAIMAHIEANIALQHEEDVHATVKIREEHTETLPVHDVPNQQR